MSSVWDGLLRPSSLSPGFWGEIGKEMFSPWRNGCSPLAAKKSEELFD